MFIINPYRFTPTGRNIPASPLLYLHAGKAKTGTLPGNNTDPTSTWADLSGGGYDGSVENAAYTTSSGWAGAGTAGDPYRFKFDGTDDRIKILYNAGWKPTTAFTISAWVAAHATNARPFYSCLEGGGFELTVATTNLFKARANINGAIREVIDTVSYSLDTIYHVMMIYDGSNFRAYKDNVEFGTAVSVTGNVTAFTNNLYLGCELGSGGATNHKNSSMYDFRIYNYAFDESQRAQDYNAGIIF